jgi:hypothetical protein
MVPSWENVVEQHASSLILFLIDLYLHFCEVCFVNVGEK